MSVLPEKKLKQARLSFNTTPAAKKRKHDDETSGFDLCKFRKTYDGPELEQNSSSNVSENVNVEENEISTENKQNVTHARATRKTKGKIDRFVVRRENRSGPEAENMDVVAVTDDPPLESETELVPEISNVDENLKVPAELTVKTTENANAGATVAIVASDVKATSQAGVADISISESDTSLNPSELASDGNSDRNKSHDPLLKKRITPKQLLKRQEAEARRLEREKIKKEKEQKRLEEKEMKEKKRLAEIEAKNEEKRQKEEEKRLKEEERKSKEEEKRKLKEEEKRLKEEERKAKEEERKAKEEERRAKEEERKLKMEEKQKKEELEKKHKEKIAAAFTNFFLPKKPIQSKTAETVEKPQASRFMPFEVKADMKLADITRAFLAPEQKAYLDHVLEGNAELDSNSLYLARLKSGDYKPGHSEDTWPLNLNDDDDDDLKDDGTPGNDVRTRFRGKLFQFTENRRPAYWGTWRKHSKSISGRTPFKCDSEFFEYDIDSDEEWVEEPGESLHGSDDEKESDHEYEVDNVFFVPHGYLSDEEAQDDDIKDESPRDQKLKLNKLEKEFEAELNEKTQKLRSRHYGCFWISNSVDRNEGADDVENLLLSFRAVWNEELSPFCWKTESPCSSAQTTPSTKTKRLSEFPEQLIPDLIRLIHGNKNSRKNLAAEFVSYVLSKDPSTHLASLCVRKKMKDISSWQVTACYWSVNDEVRALYNLSELSSSNNDWKYVSTACTQTPVRKGQKQSEKPPPVDLPTQVVAAPVVKHNSIAKFVKKLTPEERERQLKAAVVEKKTEPTSPIVSSPAAAEQKRKDNPEEGKPAKKRAVLCTMKKDGVWTWNPGLSSTVATTTEKGCEADPEAKNSIDNVTVNESAAVMERGSVLPESDPKATSNVRVTVNGASSTIVATSTAGNDMTSKDENPLESGDALSASKSTDGGSNGHERAEPLAGVRSSSENAVTVKHGKKYATLITVGKLRE